MTKDERIKKSYDFAADLSKQMITLSTAVITLCVAFTDKLFTSSAAQANSCWLMASLIVFVMSISIGVFHLMGLTGQLGKETVNEPVQSDNQQLQSAEAGRPAQESHRKDGNDDVSIYSPTNRWTSLFQVLTFVTGLALALIYIGCSIPSSTVKVEKQEEKVDTTKCIRILRTSEYVIINGERVDTLYLSK